MQTYISLLRGINVGGSKKIKMDALKSLYENLGFKSPTTYIQTGNVIFKSSLTDQTLIAKKIEKIINKNYAFEVIVLIRHLDEFTKIIKNNPFIEQSARDPDKVLITFLSDKPEESLVEKLALKKDPSEQLQLNNHEIYLHCPNGYGKTKLANHFIERTLKLNATTRNIKSILKIYKLASAH